jgi:hypothetical protein
MKNLSLICCVLLLFLIMKNAFSQVNKPAQVAEMIKQAACQSKTGDKRSAAFQLMVKDSSEMSDSETYLVKLSKKTLKGNNFVLRNLLTERDIKIIKDEGDSLHFLLDKVFNGLETTVKEIYFQLRDDQFCYEYIFKAIRKTDPKPTKDEKPKAAIKVADFNFESLIETAAPCESCEPKIRRIEYDFSKNELHSVWPGTIPGKGKKFLFNRFTYGLPWIGKAFAFQVLNVNPFRFDVTLEQELIELTSEIPDIFQLVSKVGGTKIVAASASATPSAANTRKDSLEATVIKLKDQLGTKIIELRDAGDCFASCTAVTKVDTAITGYFKRHYQYKPQEEGLDAFLFRELELGRQPADAGDSTKIDAIKKIVKMYRTFRTMGSSMVSYLIPQTQNVDQYLFKLNITPKEGVATGSRVLNQEIVVDVLGGLKLDVSSGLFFSTLSDEKFSLRADSTLVGTGYTYRKEVVQEKGKSKDFGISSLVHFYPRLTRDVNLGVHLGAGMTVNDKPKLRFLTGLSLLIGRTNRIALSGGWAMGYVDRLSDVYTRGTDNNIFTKNSETSAQIQKVFQRKSYFSLTYTIPIKRKKAEVKAADSGEEEDASGEKTEEKKAANK